MIRTTCFQSVQRGIWGIAGELPQARLVPGPPDSPVKHPLLVSNFRAHAFSPVLLVSLVRAKVTPIEGCNLRGTGEHRPSSPVFVPEMAEITFPQSSPPAPHGLPSGGRDA